MRRNPYRLSRSDFRRYRPQTAARHFADKAKLAGHAPGQVADLVKALVVQDSGVDPVAAGHLFEVMLLDAAHTGFLSPSHGLEKAWIARRPNQPFVDIAAIREREVSALYSVKWAAKEETAVKVARSAWGGLSPTAQLADARPYLIINQPIQDRLAGSQQHATKVPSWDQFRQWWEDRFCRQIRPALEDHASHVAPCRYEGREQLALNPIQRDHLGSTRKALKGDGRASWHLCPAYGKTELGLAVLAELMARFGPDDIALVAVPRLALADQWRRRARQYAEFNDTAVEIFGTYEANADVTIDAAMDDGATDPASEESWDRSGTTDVAQTLEAMSGFTRKLIVSTYHSLGALVGDRRLRGRVRVLIADEAHRSGCFFSPRNGSASDWRKLARRDRTQVILASATMPRNLEQQLGLSDSTCRLNLDQALHEKEYARVLARGKHARLCDLWGLVRLAHKRDVETDLLDFLTRRLPAEVRERNGWSASHPVKTIIFTGTIAAARDLRDQLRRALPAREGRAVFAVSSSRRTSDGNDSPQRHLRRALESFNCADARLHYLINANLLTEGVDLPSCHAAVVLSPRSFATLTQIMGRAVRADAGKRAGVVAFYGSAPPDPGVVEPALEVYRRDIELTTASAYLFVKAVQGAGAASEAPSGRRDGKIIVLDERGAVAGTALERTRASVQRFGMEHGVTRSLDPKSISVTLRKTEILRYIEDHGQPPPAGHPLQQAWFSYRHIDPDFREKCDAALDGRDSGTRWQLARKKRDAAVDYIRVHKRFPSPRTEIGRAFYQRRGYDVAFRRYADELLQQVGGAHKFEDAKRKRALILAHIREHGMPPAWSSALGATYGRYRHSDPEFRDRADALLRRAGRLSPAERVERNRQAIVRHVRLHGRLPPRSDRLGPTCSNYRRTYPAFRREIDALLKQQGGELPAERVARTRQAILAYIRKRRRLPPQSDTLGKRCGKYRAKDPEFKAETDRLRKQAGGVDRRLMARQKIERALAFIKRHRRFPPAKTPIGVAFFGRRGSDEQFKKSTDRVLERVGGVTKRGLALRKRREILRYAQLHQVLPRGDHPLAGSCRDFLRTDAEFQGRVYAALKRGRRRRG